MLSQHSKKHHHTDAANVVPDPLVDPGNPSHRHQARSTAHLDRPCSRLVALAAGSPGRCSSRPSQKENATVMLGWCTFSRAGKTYVNPARSCHRPDHSALTVTGSSHDDAPE